ncbi:MAG: hypothetical protein ACYDCL_06845 [Myxococcales bacterium]
MRQRIVLYPLWAAIERLRATVGGLPAASLWHRALALSPWVAPQSLCGAALGRRATAHAP